MLESKDLIVCALLYGDYPEMHARLLSSMNQTIPHDTQVRFWCNQVCQPTYDAITKLPSNYKIHRMCSVNTPKYKAMRDMFEPIKKGSWKWLCWLDDDTWFTKTDWFEQTATYIERRPVENVSYIGQKWYVHYLPGQTAFVAKSPWYHGRAPELIGGKPGVHFHTGGYWWIKTDLIKRLDWPDPRLSHNGGDTLLGSAMWQLQLPMHHYDYGVKVNDAKRRGRSEAPAGSLDPNTRR